MSLETGSNEELPPSEGRKRILVVEDDRIVQRSLRQLLTEEGYEVISALDGSEGMAQAQHASPNLIILDLGLPTDPFSGGQFDGFGVMQWLRRRMQGIQIPVIILTARQDQASRKQAFELGASAYLTKPFKPEELFKAIRIVLDDI
jgi:DNA-binding response OmpR family regulator